MEISEEENYYNNNLINDNAKYSGNFSTKPQILDYALDCAAWNQSNACPRDYPTSYKPLNPNNSTCPEYFRWIYEDLKPWKETGITRKMLEKAKWNAYFRLVILDGRIHVEKYNTKLKRSFQTRHLFTMYGIVQLLRWYPGKLPNLEIMFKTDDLPAIRSKDYRGPDSGPPPLFSYCSDLQSLDIVFPDWSFWGWAEINIKPWRNVIKDIKEGNKRTKWKDRVPFAYWKGNPNVSPIRKDLLKCNVTDKQSFFSFFWTDNNDFDTLLYVQDWIGQSKNRYKESNLEGQCTHRYKIYVEGSAWSVSEKYILACDSPTLYIRTRYHDFFSRWMIPQQHYWPIRDKDKCRSLKFAVEWGNNHTDKAQGIGKAGSQFIHEDLKMEYVYDYMFHLLNEYAKLLKFEPRIPANAVEICSESLACTSEGIWRKFMEEALEKSPNNTNPCTLPPPYDPRELKAFDEQKIKATQQVEAWEDEYWSRLNNKH
ncbi:uncharacterized protein LOC132063989 isoform X1 [Lycium ferocissimum]|uniref:uncharacterized protein LOC132063989 isoform X1 n=1 Tax=Lycium ferocissimum TaxID=112874 RepID=UPI002815357E|nr:uncharacterized protein LOC132063989 isoform X1 [Lycium ferocissimum]